MTTKCISSSGDLVEKHVLKEITFSYSMNMYIFQAATMGAVKELLLETLNDLSYEEQKNFTWFLQFTFFKRSLPLILGKTIWWGQEDWVKVMVETCGEESLEVIKQVFKDMNRIDLVQRLSESSSPPKGKIKTVTLIYHNR